ncbi:MAG TPA: 7-cyano-7-deazaguanine synthase QueC [Thermoplasmata archaeon]|nr:7-cyano-7-deazaguanine synthase QueC [Thermoplasmata archaeon]
MNRGVRRPRSLVLLSGGMDSATALYWAKARSSSVDALTVHYGQRHAREIRSARDIARAAGVRRHLVLRLPLGDLLRSGLTDPTAPLRSGGVRGGIPGSYVPARNTILLAIALGVAESGGCDRIVLGINAIDYSGYPDCRPEYLRAFRRLARLATKAGEERGAEPRVEAPLLRLSKAGIVRLGERLGVPWALTWSCYRGRARPCGRCDSCRLRSAGFAEAGRPDPLEAPHRGAGDRRRGLRST